MLEDLTGGFNYGSGTVEVQCPPVSAIEPLAGRRLHWLRCRIAETTRIGGEPAIYTQPPEIYSDHGRAPRRPARRRALGASSSPSQLGVSDGSPGQTFATRYAPVLELAAEETLEVQTAGGDWEPWEERDTFAGSESDDRHFVLDRVHGRDPARAGAPRP